MKFSSKFGNIDLKIERDDPNIEVIVEMETKSKNASICPILNKIHQKLMKWQAINVQPFFPGGF